MLNCCSSSFSNAINMQHMPYCKHRRDMWQGKKNFFVNFLKNPTEPSKNAVFFLPDSHITLYIIWTKRFWEHLRPNKYMFQFSAKCDHPYIFSFTRFESYYACAERFTSNALKREKHFSSDANMERGTCLHTNSVYIRNQICFLVTKTRKTSELSA